MSSFVVKNDAENLTLLCIRKTFIFQFLQFEKYRENIPMFIRGLIKIQFSLLTPFVMQKERKLPTVSVIPKLPQRIQNPPHKDPIIEVKLRGVMLTFFHNLGIKGDEVGLHPHDLIIHRCTLGSTLPTFFMVASCSLSCPLHIVPE